jgi:hypothetical protein
MASFTRTGARRHAAGRWTLVAVALCVASCGGGSRSSNDNGEAALTGTSAAATPTTDPVVAARAKGRRLAKAGKYTAAVAAYESAELHGDAARVRRQGARALTRSARRALAGGRYTTARRLALQSTRLRKTTAARTVLADAGTRIAAAKVAERERRRLAAIARDQRTCSSSEKSMVREGGGTPAGCATYAARREATGSDCDPNYTGACLKPDSYDYDCAGGSGDGPDYTGPVQVVGDDPYDLDRDGDGYACESS